MRIIAGSARGRQIKAPDGISTRPTMDKVREAIFGRLQFGIPDSTVLDMFAGSGAMGLEALSRGAAKCVFIEKSRSAMAIVKSNCELLGFTDRAVFILSDYKDVKFADSFDYVFIDPPYASGLYYDPMEKVSNHLNDGAVVVCEHNEPIEFPPKYVLDKEKTYSGTSISYFVKEADK